VFAGGGTITGVTTASGSGLTGGGTSGTLNLSLTNACAKDQVLQWSGTAWDCASAGTGTITGVTAGTDLSGGGTSGNVTLNLNTTATNALYAQLAAANTFTGNQTVNGSLSATGAVTGSSFQIGSNLFAFGSYTNANAFLGFAGNSTTTGINNTATGQYALASNSKGDDNTATGVQALVVNTTGYNNTATGWLALESNTTGAANTATGVQALSFNTTGYSNTATGLYALLSSTTGSYNTASGTFALNTNTTGNANSALGSGAGETGDGSNVTGNNNTAVGSSAFFGTGTLSNATAIGANSEVTASNAMVLGGITGVNNGTDTFVGIGTTKPANLLTLVGDITTVADTVLSVSSASPDGTWIALTNTYDSGGKTWDIISAGPGDGEGDGNLVFTRLGGGTVQVDGNLVVTGNLSKGGGTFQIDHPLDPANKYLYHSFVESPDMMNVYNGNVSTNRNGLATVILPDYFEALNRDFRYQLTVIGQFAEAIVARKIGNNRFIIRTSKPNVEVSWQVTGVRHDAYANAHPIQVEVEKPPQEQGHYLHPELFGAPTEQAIGYHAPPSGPRVARAQPSSLTPTTPAN